MEIRETVREIEVSRYSEITASGGDIADDARRVFVDVADDELLGYGVPDSWLDDVKGATEDSLLELTEHLPEEAAEALLELATGGSPMHAVPPAHVGVMEESPPAYSSPAPDPFAHPDAQRRFRTMEDAEELRRALDYPWEKWIVFLHPAQRRIVERDYRGPARVAGSAGTGKTVVALHRRSTLPARIPMPESCWRHSPRPWRRNCVFA